MLQIDVYDEDIGSSDDLIGSYKLITDDLSRADNLVWDSPAEWYDPSSFLMQNSSFLMRNSSF